MGYIGRRLTRGQVKPYNSVPRIDWSHPLAQSLSIYCYDAGGFIIDLVNYGGIGTVNGTSGLQQTKFGPALRIPLAGFVSMPPLPGGSEARWGGVAPYTGLMATQFLTATGPSSPDSVVVSIQDAGNSENTAFGFNTFPGPPNNVAVVTDNAFATQYTNAITLNAFQSWGFIATGGSAGSLYLNGTLDSNMTQTTTDTSTPNGQVMYNTASINAGQTFGNGINGFVYYFAMWSRALSQRDLVSLHLDPYQFLIYPEEDFDIVGTVVAADVLAAMQFRWM